MPYGQTNQPRPNFFLVGAAKSGTTSLAYYLGQHPDIFMAPGEPRYFGRDVPGPERRLTEREYLELFAGAGKEKIIGEKTPAYLHSRLAAREIHAFNAQARILVILRNPVDMVYSLHGQLAFKSFREDILDFETALNAEADRRQGKRLPANNRHDAVLFYSEIAYYSVQLGRYLEVFDRRQVLVLIFDDFMADPGKTLRTVFEFLELDPDFQPDMAIQNRAVAWRSLGTQKWLKRTAKRMNEPGFVLPGLLRTALRKVYRAAKRFNAKPEGRPPLPEHLRTRLQSIYAADVKKLSIMLNRDLTHWTG